MSLLAVTGSPSTEINCQVNRFGLKRFAARKGSTAARSPSMENPCRIRKWMAWGVWRLSWGMKDCSHYHALDGRDHDSYFVIYLVRVVPNPVDDYRQYLFNVRNIAGHSCP
jgi:hypothetical protein